MPDDDDSFKFVVANCEGVTGKKQLIENMLASSQPDVFIAVESKLDDSVYDSEFLPSTYLPPPLLLAETESEVEVAFSLPPRMEYPPHHSPFMTLTVR